MARNLIRLRARRGDNMCAISSTYTNPNHNAGYIYMYEIKFFHISAAICSCRPRVLKELDFTASAHHKMFHSISEKFVAN